MCTAFCIVDVVAEAQNILAEIIGILESHFYLDAVCLSLEVDRLMKCLRTVVQITDVSDDPLRLMVFQFLRLRTAADPRNRSSGQDSGMLSHGDGS